MPMWMILDTDPFYLHTKSDCITQSLFFCQYRE